MSALAARMSEMRSFEPSSSGRRFDLFYASGTGGPHAIFGENPKAS